MKTKLLILILFFFAISASAQSLTLAELQNLCKLSNWQSGHDLLTQKGWEFHGSSKGDYDHYASIDYAYSKTGWNGDYATAWLTLYIDGSKVEKVHYQAPKNTYNIIVNSLSVNGYKRTDSEIQDGDIITYYTSKSFDLKLTTTTVDKEYGGQGAAYSIIILRKYQ